MTPGGIHPARQPQRGTAAAQRLGFLSEGVITVLESLLVLALFALALAFSSPASAQLDPNDIDRIVESNTNIALLLWWGALFFAYAKGVQHGVTR